MRTSIAEVREDGIAVRGRDLARDLMGRVSFTNLTFLLIAGREPTEAEETVLDACLVALADHGLTLSAVVARATSATAPEALQGAVAAGLLGVGDAILGTMEGCGEALHELAAAGAAGTDPGEAAAVQVARARSAGRRIPGFGHTMHRGGDPRADRLLELAREQRVAGEHVRLLVLLAEQLSRQSGRTVPLNVTGAAAGVLMDMGFGWPVLRGFALIARCAGLVAHVWEEQSAPVVPGLRQFLAEPGPAGPQSTAGQA